MVISNHKLPWYNDHMQKYINYTLIWSFKQNETYILIIHITLPFLRIFPFDRVRPRVMFVGHRGGIPWQWWRCVGLILWWRTWFWCLTTHDISNNRNINITNQLWPTSQTEEHLFIYIFFDKLHFPGSLIDAKEKQQTNRIYFGNDLNTEFNQSLCWCRPTSTSSIHRQTLACLVTRG